MKSEQYLQASELVRAVKFIRRAGLQKNLFKNFFQKVSQCRKWALPLTGDELHPTFSHWAHLYPALIHLVEPYLNKLPNFILP